jgi:phage-related protein (TIGR01555 family)
MSKRNRRAVKDSAPAPQIQAVKSYENFKGIIANDAFQNMLARTGAGMPNLMEGTRYVNTRLSQNNYLMNALYRSNWLIRRVIDLIPKDMLKNGWKYQSDLDPAKLGKLEDAEKITRLKPTLLRGLSLGRLYGGAAGLMLIDGQEAILDKPLDIESIYPGDFKGLLLTDRWSGIYPQQELVDDINSPEFGLPKFYEFRNSINQTTFRVHHSRLIRFTGDDLPEWERYAENYWGSSKVEALYEELKKRDNSSANIAMLIFQANFLVWKSKDLDVFMSTANDEMKQRFMAALQAQNWLRSSHGTQVIGSEDEMQSLQYGFGGLNDVYKEFKLDFCGAAQIPYARLFGDTNSGLNSTGEGDMRNYYDVIESEQEAHLRPALDKISSVLQMSVWGKIEDDVKIVFNPIETMSDEKKAELGKSKTEAIMIPYSQGLISPRLTMMELKQSAESTGLWTNITDEDIESASEQPDSDFQREMMEESAAGEPDGDSEKKNISRYVDEYKHKGRRVPGHWT